MGIWGSHAYMYIGMCVYIDACNYYVIHACIYLCMSFSKHPCMNLCLYACNLYACNLYMHAIIML